MSSSTTEILKKYRSIAVVGISRSKDKDAHKIPKYMKSQGYTIIPINPFADEILGEKCYGSLLDMPKAVQNTVEIVNVFRPSRDAFEVVEKAVEMKRNVGRPFVVWMQLGIVNEEAAELARREDMEVVMDRCLLVEHKRMLCGN
jgi:predicted CoA-binding protein